MTTSRTGTAQWKKLVSQARAKAQDNGLTTCPLCNTWMNFDHAQLPNSPELDHIIPFAEGGTNDEQNLRIICRSCNQKRGGSVGNQRMRAAKLQAKVTPINAEPSFDW